MAWGSRRGWLKSLDASTNVGDAEYAHPAPPIEAAGGINWYMEDLSLSSLDLSFKLNELLLTKIVILLYLGQKYFGLFFLIILWHMVVTYLCLHFFLLSSQLPHLLNWPLR